MFKKILTGIAGALVLCACASVSFGQYTPGSAERIQLSADTQNATNGQVLTLTKSLTIIKPISGANTATNTVTITGPLPQSNTVYTLVVQANATNALIVTASGVMAQLQSDWFGQTNQALQFLAVSTNKVAEIGRTQ